MRRSRTVVAVAVLALLTVAGSQAYLETRPERADAAETLLYLPNGRFLRLAALGHPSFMADLIYLWSIQYYSTRGKGERYLLLEHVYGEVIARLDPNFIDPYLIGALILVVEKHDVEAALRLLDRGMEANPTEWILPYQAGFWSYDGAHDYERAAAYFSRAMEIPGAPPSTRRLHAEMHNKRGDKQMSLALWREVLQETDDDRVRAIAANHVHDLTVETDLMALRAATDAYTSRRGRPPDSLEDLVHHGDLETLPIDPDGAPYLYHADTGEVEAQAAFRLRRH